MPKKKELMKLVSTISMSSTEKKQTYLFMKLKTGVIKMHVQNPMGFHAYFDCAIDSFINVQKLDTVCIHYSAFCDKVKKTHMASNLTFEYSEDKFIIHEILLDKNSCVKLSKSWEIPYVKYQEQDIDFQQGEEVKNGKMISSLEISSTIKTIPQLDCLTFYTHKNVTYALSTIGAGLQGLVLKNVLFPEKEEWTLPLSYVKNFQSFEKVAIKFAIDNEPRLYIEELEENGIKIVLKMKKGKANIYDMFMPYLQNMDDWVTNDIIFDKKMVKKLEKSINDFRKENSEDITDKFLTQVQLDGNSVVLKTRNEGKIIEKEIPDCSIKFDLSKMTTDENASKTSLILSYYDFLKYLKSQEGENKGGMLGGYWMIRNKDRFLFSKALNV